MAASRTLLALALVASLAVPGGVLAQDTPKYETPRYGSTTSGVSHNDMFDEYTDSMMSSAQPSAAGRSSDEDQGVASFFGKSGADSGWPGTNRSVGALFDKSDGTSNSAEVPGDRSRQPAREHGITPLASTPSYGAAARPTLRDGDR